MKISYERQFDGTSFNVGRKWHWDSDQIEFTESESISNIGEMDINHRSIRSDCDRSTDEELFRYRLCLLKFSHVCEVWKERIWRNRSLTDSLSHNFHAEVQPNWQPLWHCGAFVHYSRRRDIRCVLLAYACGVCTCVYSCEAGVCSVCF